MVNAIDDGLKKGKEFSVTNRARNCWPEALELETNLQSNAPFGSSKSVVDKDANTKKKTKSTEKSTASTTPLNKGVDMSVRNTPSHTNFTSDKDNRRGMVVPFKPLSLAFENVNYYVDMPPAWCFDSISGSEWCWKDHVDGCISGKKNRRNDIHSPHVTIHESLVYSAWLRLGPDVSNKTQKVNSLLLADSIADTAQNVQTLVKYLI
ncbi:hypothetical protein AgCh_003011 [Apium graveolens]